MGLAIRRSAVQQNPDLLRGFLKAFLNGLKVAIEQPEASKRALAKYLGTKDQEIIDEAYKSFAALFPKVPYVTDDAIRAAIAVTDHPQSGDGKSERFLRQSISSGTGDQWLCEGALCLAIIDFDLRQI